MCLPRFVSVKFSRGAIAIVPLLLIVLMGCGEQQSHAPPQDLLPITRAFPGPQAPSVPQVITAAGIDSRYLPIDPTTQFRAGQTVYVVFQTLNITDEKQHTVTVRWFLNGQELQLPTPESDLTVVYKGKSRGAFGLSYPVPGVGQATLCWDQPVADCARSGNDPTIAQTVTFVIDDGS